MSLSFHGAGASHITNGDIDLNPAIPASMGADYIMIMPVYLRASGSSPGEPSQWNKVIETSGNSNRLRIYSKIWEAGDTDPVIPHNASAPATATWGARIFAYKSDVAGVSVGVNTATTGPVAEDIGPISGISALAGQIVCVFGGRRDDATSVAVLSGDGLTWNERWDEASTVGNDAHFVYDDCDAMVSDTVITAKTFDVTLGSGGTREWAGAMIALSESQPTTFVPKVMVM